MALKIQSDLEQLTTLYKTLKDKKLQDKEFQQLVQKVEKKVLQLELDVAKNPKPVSNKLKTEILIVLKNLEKALKSHHKQTRKIEQVSKVILQVQNHIAPPLPRPKIGLKMGF